MSSVASWAAAAQLSSRHLGDFGRTCLCHGQRAGGERRLLGTSPALSFSPFLLTAPIAGRGPEIYELEAASGGADRLVSSANNAVGWTEASPSQGTDFVFSGWHLEPIQSDLRL